MRCCIYARYSTDRQSESSIDDQARVCRHRAASEGWTVVVQHGDDGVSGSTPVAGRRGGTALLADALARRFDVLLLEGLDRLSRDMVESERIVRRLEHAGIRIVGVSDGYDSTSSSRKLHRGMRGILNEVYLDDLRSKTHRGLAGKVERGFSAGGRSFGYRTRAVDGGHRLEIDESQAAVVREIFARYGRDGWSPQRIAHDLNTRGIPSPRGGSWAVSAIYGSPAKGSGILNNELYAGRVVWNRSQWIKDPDTGARVRTDRPRSEWQTEDRPELRIVDAGTWAAVRARMDRPRVEGGPGKSPLPRTLFGGMLRCARCGGAMVATDARRYGCAAAKDRGPAVCAGTHVLRKAADERLLSVVREEFLAPEALLEAQRVISEVAGDRARAGRAADRQAAARIGELDAEIGRLVDAIAAVGLSPAIQARLQAAESERARIVDQQQAASRQRPAADVGRALLAYRQAVMRIEEALSGDRDSARAMLAELLGTVTVERRGAEVWATLETIAPAQLMLAGAQMGSVAGARSFTQSRALRLI